MHMATVTSELNFVKGSFYVMLDCSGLGNNLCTFLCFEIIAFLFLVVILILNEV